MPFGLIRRSFVVLVTLVAFNLQAHCQDAASSRSDQPLLKAEKLDALVAPIALFPDTLLAEIFMASTYPLEVVQAERWLRDNKQQRDNLKSEADKQTWDQSVKSLIATPSVLEMMSNQLEWTQKLGNAVLAQQSDVMEAVQRLRSKAYENKKLTSTKEQTVTVKQENDKQVIAVGPAAAETISVPYYDPAVVYGAWPYSDYPPYYFPPPDYIPAGIIATGVAFGAGYLLGRWTSGGNFWGGGIHWGGGNIDINRPINIDRDRVTHWQHNPSHRHGVKYPNANLQQRFGNDNVARGGRDGKDLKRGTNRGSAADRSPANNKNLAGRNTKKAGTKHAGAPKSASAKAKHAAGSPKAHKTAQAHRPKHAQAARRNPSHAKAKPHRVSNGGGGRARAHHGRRGGGRGGGRRR